MHESQRVLDALGVSTPPALHQPLSGPGEAQLKASLLNDASHYIRHAALALAQGMADVQAERCTWATVQLYYSVFYSSRALLAADDFCVFYSNGSPRLLLARAGEMPVKAAGATHLVTLRAYEERYPNSFFLSQQIDQLSPIQWLCRKREDANYRLVGPTEPLLPPELLKPVSIGIRRAVAAYLRDTIYTFDPDHALVAFPLGFFREALTVSRNKGIPQVDSEFQKTLAVLLRDRSGPVTELVSLMAA
ncbi:MAG: hypothetical protein M3463_00590 [Verrucomicrobiota bacterium]|nr:hypothetical protein [Verrucomicrobiota bacterium]